MSKSSSFAKTKFILKMINNIETIVLRHKGISKALEDTVEASPAFKRKVRKII